MNQKICVALNNKLSSLEMPSATTEVIPGVLWGDATHLYTPAYWKALCWLSSFEDSMSNYRLGNTINEEIAACILGGYGIPAEVGLAAFDRVRDAGVLDQVVGERVIFDLLSQPLEVGKTRVRYRFAKQKSYYLSRALFKLANEEAPMRNAVDLRSWLLTIDGIGLKTASWITRNWLGSDDVAIIDVHIHRAGRLMNLFDCSHSPARSYLAMEQRFVDFCTNIEVKTSVLDALIWQQMKEAGRFAISILNSRGN